VSSNLNAGCPYLFQAGVADFIAEGHFSRHLKKMRLLYADRRAAAQSAFQQVLGDRIRIDLQPGGLHMLAKLGVHEDDVMLAERAREAGFAMHALSRWYINAKQQQGLLMGFANVLDDRHAMQLALKLRDAIS